MTDDGVATGATMKAAARVVSRFAPREMVVAVPVIAWESLEEIKAEVDKVVYLEAPEVFFSLSQFYRNFDQITDEEVLAILKAQKRKEGK